MKMFRELPYRLRITDFDAHEHLLPGRLLDVFQDLATIQAEDMGMGLATIRERNLMWAVIRTKYEIVKQPELHQEVMVRTWPHSPSRFSFKRDYAIHSLDGELLAKSTSEWVLMYREERTFANIKDHYDGPTDFCEERTYEHKLRKLPNFEAQGEPLAVVPGYSDMDVNGHVNNAKYLNYALDAWVCGNGEPIVAMQVGFRKEVTLGEELLVFTAREGDTLYARGEGADGTVFFACEATLG